MLRVQRRRSRAPARPLVLVVCLGSVLSLVVAGGLGARNQKFLLDHYECYLVKPFQSFEPREVKLQDQFGERPATITGPSTLCNPVSKNGSLVRRKDAHLLCYAQKRTDFKQRTVAIANQFGSGKLTIGYARTLCLPSGKSKTSTAPKIPPRFDHYACYLAKPASVFSKRKVKLKDQFWATTAVVGLPNSLCNPVSKNGGQVVNRNDHLVCYPIAPSSSFAQVDVNIVNQFEEKARYTAYKPVTLCVPSTKREVS